MIETKVFNPIDKPNISEKKEIIEFLYSHLENYGDSKIAIERAVDYAIKETPSFGGFVLISKNDQKISGVVVINKTGMKGYIPENILVYIATHKEQRGKGIGKMLMKETIKLVHGDIALHVEPENPAKFLYEKFGFSNKYLEMRLVSPTN